MYEYLGVFTVGVIGSLLVYAGLARTLWSLRCDIQALQDQFLRLRNTTAATIRHSKDKDVDLIKELQGAPVKVPSGNPLRKFGIGA